MLEDDGGPDDVGPPSRPPPGGTTERVQLGANGTVDRIQRFYDFRNLALHLGGGLLRRSGVVHPGGARPPVRLPARPASKPGRARDPSHDVFIRGGAFDLTREGDLLGLSERVVLDHFCGRRAAGNAWVEVGPGCEIDPSARLIGPVVLQFGAVIGPGATVVGPAVIGAEDRLERAAMVAQCVVGFRGMPTPRLS